MTNPDDPAFNGLPGSGSPGLTKREYFAAMALQGLLAGSQGKVAWSEKQFAIGAINLADALIAELSKK